MPLKLALENTTVGPRIKIVEVKGDEKGDEKKETGNTSNFWQINDRLTQIGRIFISDAILNIPLTQMVALQFEFINQLMLFININSAGKRFYEYQEGLRQDLGTGTEEAVLVQSHLSILNINILPTVQDALRLYLQIQQQLSYASLNPPPASSLPTNTFAFEFKPPSDISSRRMVVARRTVPTFSLGAPSETKDQKPPSDSSATTTDNSANKSQSSFTPKQTL